jgi:DNA-binding response OmpR family regulator
MESLRARILCTEDDRDTREMIRIILTGAHFDVIFDQSSDETIDRDDRDLYVSVELKIKFGSR